MDTTSAQPRTPLRPRRHAVRIAALALAAAVGLLLTACGSSNSPEGASLTSTPAASSTVAPPSSAPSDGGPAAGAGGQQISVAIGGVTVAYSQCMRSHGVANFPDPDADGKVSISSTNGSALDPRSASFQAAQKDCAKYLPNGGTPNASQQAQDRAQTLKFSQCMRSHGVPNFPDPNSDGSISIDSSSGIDPQPASF